MAHLPARPRFVVETFAKVMEKKLQDNDHKGDRTAWQETSPEWFLRRVREETKELDDAVRKYRSFLEHRNVLLLSETEKKKLLELQTAIVEEAADVANIAMMVADAMHCLPPDPK